MASGADRRLFWAVATAVVAADVFTKLLAEARLSYRPLPVIGDWVRLRLIYNEGAAFGLHLGDHSRWIFFGLALLALVVLGSMVRSTRTGDAVSVRRAGPDLWRRRGEPHRPRAQRSGRRGLS